MQSFPSIKYAGLCDTLYGCCIYRLRTSKNSKKCKNILTLTVSSTTTRPWDTVANPNYAYTYYINCLLSYFNAFVPLGVLLSTLMYARCIRKNKSNNI